MPFETIRRRLQLQARGIAKPIKFCVDPRPLPYNGAADAFWRIITEKRSNLPERWKGKGKEKDVVVMKERSMGVEQLFRGPGMRPGACFLVFLPGITNSGFVTDSGWAELYRPSVSPMHSVVIIHTQFITTLRTCGARCEF